MRPADFKLPTSLQLFSFSCEDGDCWLPLAASFLPASFLLIGMGKLPPDTLSQPGMAGTTTYKIPTMGHHLLFPTTLPDLLP